MIANIKHAVFPIGRTFIICSVAECLATDKHDAVRNRDARKTRATFKCRIADACHTVRNLYARKHRAITECFHANARDGNSVDLARNHNIRLRFSIGRQSGDCSV